MGDILAYNTMQEGFERVTVGFNGLQELLMRKDAETKLIESYLNMAPEALDPTWTLEKKGKYAAKFYFIEILMAQETILANMQKETRFSLSSEVMRKVYAKRKHPEIYSLVNFENIALLLGRIMLKDNDAAFRQRVAENEKLNTFLQRATLSDVELVNEILYFAEQYLNKNR